MADTTTQRQSFGLLRLTLFHPKAKRAIETSNTRIHPKADSGARVGPIHLRMPGLQVEP